MDNHLPMFHRVAPAGRKELHHLRWLSAASTRYHSVVLWFLLGGRL